MWLQDFLPQEFKNVRILSYGYNSALVGNIEDDDIEDYRSAFLQRILSSRRDVRVLLQSFCHSVEDLRC